MGVVHKMAWWYCESNFRLGDQMGFQCIGNKIPRDLSQCSKSILLNDNLLIQADDVLQNTKMGHMQIWKYQASEKPQKNWKCWSKLSGEVMVEHETLHSSLLLALKMVHSIPQQLNTNKNKDKISNKEANAFFKAVISEGKKNPNCKYLSGDGAQQHNPKTIHVNPDTNPGFVNII